MFRRLDAPFHNRAFISIVILSYQRPDYTLRCLESLMKNMDVAAEIILVDDASHKDNTQERLFREMLPMVSTMILNNGVNKGFTAAANQATALCSSDYVVLLNNDVEMVGPGLAAIGNALACPYVGTLGITGGMKNYRGVPVHHNGSDLVIGALPGGSGLFAYRKEVWAQMGGFVENYNNGGDIGFMYSLTKNGYFNGTLIAPEKIFINRDQEDNYKAATAGTTPFGNSYPRLFGVDPHIYQEECLKRRERVYYWSHNQYQIPAGVNNISYWDTYFLEARQPEGTYQWDKLGLHFQNRWSGEVDRDNSIWKLRNPEAKLSE